MDEERKAKIRTYYKKWYARNRDKKLASCRSWQAKNVLLQKRYKKKYYKKNSVEIRAKTKSYYLADPVRAKEQRRNYYLRNRDRLLELDRRRREPRKTALSAAAVNRTKKRLREDAYFRFVHNLRSSVRRRIKSRGGVKNAKTAELFGCSISALRAHLEKNFLPGMTWKNYGFRGWHIDHKIPCRAFDLTDTKQQRACFHFSNLQPLWAKDNLKKSGSLPPAQ